MKHKRGLSNAQSHKVFRTLNNEMPQFGRRNVQDQQYWEINVDVLEGMEGVDGVEEMNGSSLSPRGLPVFNEPVSVRSSPYERDIFTEEVRSER